MTAVGATDTGWERFRSDCQMEFLARAPEHIERLTWTGSQIRAAQRDGLHRLLAHARERSPFHRPRLAGIDIDHVDPADLSGLPIMSKADMMAALDDVFTDRRLSHELVEQTLASTGTEPIPILDEYVAFASGGSSGQRGVFVFDRAAYTGYALSLSRAIMARLQALGGAPPGGLPIATVAAVSAVHATGAAPAATAGPDCR
jgi:phenylacetate-CoA ligase